jgi:antitoxin ParD1/3/4
MARQSISLSEPNHEWIAKKIASREFKSNSEVVNDALRKVREMESGIEAIRSALIKGEESGLSTRTPDDIINAVLEKRRLDGSL